MTWTGLGSWSVGDIITELAELPVPEEAAAGVLCLIRAGVLLHLDLVDLLVLLLGGQVQDRTLGSQGKIRGTRIINKS